MCARPTLGSETPEFQKECVSAGSPERPRRACRARRPACGCCRRPARLPRALLSAGGQAPGPPRPRRDTPPGPGDTWNERRRRRLSAGSSGGRRGARLPQVPGHPGWLERGRPQLPHLSCLGAPALALFPSQRGCCSHLRPQRAHRKLCRASPATPGPHQRQLALQG